jgi:Tfp pilus assembly protein PilP
VSTNAVPVAALTTPLPFTTPPPDYDPKGRRDPFTTLEAGRNAGGLAVATAKLTGILRGETSPLALVETSDGLGYILKQGDTLGDGRLVDIGRDSVVFTVVPRAGATNNRVVLKLPGD